MSKSAIEPRDYPSRDLLNKTNLNTHKSLAISSKGKDLEQPCRIAKAIARAGLCSRREAERLIQEGRVRINGKLLTTPACVITSKDTVNIDGFPLPSAPPAQLWLYHKPKGLVTTHKDPQGRTTVFENLPSHLPRVISIGRLDYNTEGLLLLTNSGQLARELELPTTGWLRSYRVRARGRVTADDLETLKNGLQIDGVWYGPVEASIDSIQGANTWLTIGIREGKNREVRNIISFLGLTVSRLIRVSFGPFELGNLGRGEVQGVSKRHLIEAVGPKISAQIGLIQTTNSRNAKDKRQKMQPQKNETTK
ncbi:MAG: pseudouridine synthase [Hyphomicrobium sp.]